jgi:hypothetical protein
VFACLRHHPIIRCDDQQHMTDCIDTAEHVAHKPLMAGHVDESERNATDRGVRVTDLNRDPARLLLRQAVRVDAGNGTHKRGLAVVDVAGCGNDHGVKRVGSDFARGLTQSSLASVPTAIPLLHTTH